MSITPHVEKIFHNHMKFCLLVYDVPGGCKRHDGDRIDQLKSLRSRCQPGSRRWKEIGRKVTHELKKISNRQKHNEIDIARRITKGLSVLFLEDLDLTKMRRSNGAASKTGLNREMAYSRMGEFRIQLEWQMKKKGGISRRVEHAHIVSIKSFLHLGTFYR